MLNKSHITSYSYGHHALIAGDRKEYNYLINKRVYIFIILIFYVLYTIMAD